jgi:hypothetical protein
LSGTPDDLELLHVPPADFKIRCANPDVCLHHLNALVSHHPHLVEAVTPIRDFDLARYSFAENVDVVAGLDSRPDLTKMSQPSSSTLFDSCWKRADWKVGLPNVRAMTESTQWSSTETRWLVASRSSKPRGYLAGIGISHIRELVGAMDQKGAGRGILVTTSWFTAGCWIKAEQNNRIELIDGPRLRHLVKRICTWTSWWLRQRRGPARGIRRRNLPKRPTLDTVIASAAEKRWSFDLPGLTAVKFNQAPRRQTYQPDR